MDRFFQLIEDLATLLDEELVADHRNICSFLIDDKMRFQLELDQSGDHVMICADICEVPAGKYRETLFKECLKHNTLLPPRFGTFAYEGRHNRLIMFDRLVIRELRAEELLEYLSAMIPKATAWKEAIEKGHPLPTFHELPSFNSTFRGGV